MVKKKREAFSVGFLGFYSTRIKTEVKSGLCSRPHPRIKRSLLSTLESGDTWYIRIAKFYALSLSCLQHLEFGVKQQITYHTEKRTVL